MLQRLMALLPGSQVVGGSLDVTLAGCIDDSAAISLSRPGRGVKEGPLTELRPAAYAWAFDAGLGASRSPRVTPARVIGSGGRSRRGRHVAAGWDGAGSGGAGRRGAQRGRGRRRAAAHGAAPDRADR